MTRETAALMGFAVLLLIHVLRQTPLTEKLEKYHWVLQSISCSVNTIAISNLIVYMLSLWFGTTSTLSMCY